MSDAFIKWCRGSTTAQQFLDQVEKFSAAGVLLIHPVKKTGVLLDVDGSDVAAAPAEIADIIGRRVGRAISLEWWLTADTDLTCTYYISPARIILCRVAVKSRRTILMDCRPPRSLLCEALFVVYFGMIPGFPKALL